MPKITDPFQELTKHKDFQIQRLNKKLEALERKNGFYQISFDNNGNIFERRVKN